MKKKANVTSIEINNEDSPEVKKEKMIEAVDMNGAYAFIDWDDGDKSWLKYDGDSNFNYEMGGSIYTLDFEAPLENGLVVITTGVNNFNMLHK